MNIASTTLAVIIIVFPGFIFRRAYTKGICRWTSPSGARPLSEELMLGSIIAIIIHALFVVIVNNLIYPVRLDIVFSLIIGLTTLTPDLNINVIDNLSTYALRIFSYFVFVYAASYGMGLLSHYIIRRYKLDLKFRPLRFGNYWHYILSGEILQFPENVFDADIADGVYVSAIVDNANISYLYRGLVYDYSFSASGDLRYLLLSDAHRRQLVDDNSNEDDIADPHLHADQLDTSRYYPITGDIFIIDCNDITTLNITYIVISDSDPSPDILL